MSDFQWETEEEIDWGQAETAVSQPTPNRTRRTILLGGLVSLLLIAIIVTIGQQLQRRIRAGQAVVRDDLLASYDLVTEAAAGLDADIFGLLLSGRDPEWGDQMGTLVEEGLLLDRSLLGLTPDGDPTITITLSDDLLAAEMTRTQTYRYTPDGDPMETVRLAETAVYRKGENRWLLSPPTEAFWGDMDSVVDKQVIVEHARRDIHFAEGFASFYAAQHEQLCQQLQIDACPRVHLTLSTQPKTLGDAGLHAPLLTPTAIKGNELAFALASPTLFGQPVDEASEQIAFDIYAAQLRRGVAHVLLMQQGEDSNLSLIADECCDHPLFRRTLVDVYLAEAGLAKRPFSNPTWGDQNASDETLATLKSVWRSNDIHHFAKVQHNLFEQVEQLLSMPTAIPATDALHAILPRRPYEDWLAVVVNNVQLGFGSRLLQTLDGQIQIEQSFGTGTTGETAVSLPEFPLYASCATESGSIYRLVQMFPKNSQQSHALYSTQIELLPSPDNENLLVAQYEYVPTNSGVDVNPSFALIENGEARPVFSASRRPLSLYTFSPDSRALLFNDFSRGVGNYNPLLVPLEGCDGEDCLRPSSFPIWSPSGQHSLVHIENRLLGWPFSIDQTVFISENAGEWTEESRIFLADAVGNPTENSPVGVGKNPVWLDDHRFAFIGSGNQAGLSRDGSKLLLIFDRLTGEPIRHLPEEALDRVLYDASPESLGATLFYALPYPTESDALLIIAQTASEEAKNVFFHYEVTTETLTFLFAKPTLNAAVRFSPNGRFLLFETFEYRTNEVPIVTLELHDLANNDVEAFPTSQIGRGLIDWSPDNKWLAITLNQYAVGLINIETDERLLVPHEFGTCSSLSWLNTAVFP